MDLNILQHKILVKEVALYQSNPVNRAKKNFVRPPFIAWGPAGSGKTFNTTQAGTEIHFPVINIRLGQEMAEDMSYPIVTGGVLKKMIAEMWARYKLDENGDKIPRRRAVLDQDGNPTGEIEVVPGEYQIGFSDISHYVENYDEVAAYYASIKLTIDDAPGGIVFLDEINRIEDKQMFQMIFQLLESGTFKGHTIPAELTLMGACNPPDNGYIVKNWFDDPAFSNRCIHYKLLPSKEVLLDIARKAGYTDVALEFVSTYPDYLFDKKENDFNLPKNTFSFRNLSFLDNYVLGIDWDKSEMPELQRLLVGAIYGTAAMAPFITIVEKTSQKPFEIENLFKHYDMYDTGKNPFNVTTVNGVEKLEPDTLFDSANDRNIVNAKAKERKLILQSGLDSRTDFLSQMSLNLIDYIVDNVEDEKFQATFKKNRLRFLRFALDLPRDIYASMMATLVSGEVFEKKSANFFHLIEVDSKEAEAQALIEVIFKIDKMAVDNFTNN